MSVEVTPLPISNNIPLLCTEKSALEHFSQTELAYNISIAAQLKHSMISIEGYQNKLVLLESHWFCKMRTVFPYPDTLPVLMNM